MVVGVAACTSSPQPAPTPSSPTVSSPTPATETPPVAAEQDQIAAADRLVLSSEVPAELRFENGYVRAVSGRFAAAGGTPVEKARAFLQDNAALYGLDDDSLALHVRREATIAGAASAITFSPAWPQAFRCVAHR